MNIPLYDPAYTPTPERAAQVIKHGYTLPGGYYRYIYKMKADPWVYKVDRYPGRGMGNADEWSMYETLLELKKRSPVQDPIGIPEVRQVGGKTDILAMQFIPGRHPATECFDGAHYCECVGSCWADTFRSSFTYDHIIDIHARNVRIDQTGKVWVIDFGERWL